MRRRRSAGPLVYPHQVEAWRENWPAELAVPCVSCGASPGEPCRKYRRNRFGVGGNVVTPHKQRRVMVIAAR